MDKWKLCRFFCEMIELMYKYPGEPGFGNPVSWLIEQMCVYQERFLSRILGDYTGDTHECRLNNAGLKLFWSMDRSQSEGNMFRCRIGGDQAKDYPEFVSAAKEIVEKYGFDRG